MFECVSAAVSAVLPADCGHGLVGLVGSEPQPDLQGVHADGELAADTLQARLGATLQGKASLHSLLHQHLHCVLNIDSSHTGSPRPAGSSAVFLHSLQQHVSQVTLTPGLNEST